MRSIQVKMVVAFLLLILLAMQFIGAFLLRDLEAYFLREGRQQHRMGAGILAHQAADFLAATGDEFDRQGLYELVAREQDTFLLAAVLDRQGLVLAATDPTLEGQRFVIDAVAEVLATGVESSGTRPLLESSRVRAFGAAPMEIEGTIVGLAYVESDLTAAYETLQQVRQRLLVATLLALAVTGILGFFIARTITGPIQTITAQAASMAAGNFDQRIEIRAKDEVGRLAGMFNYLAEQLRETLDEIAAEQRKVEAIVTHMADGVVAVDAQVRLLFINPAARAMLGVTMPEDELIGQHPQDLWPDLPIAKHLQRALTDLAAEEDVRLAVGDRILRASFAPIRREIAGGSGIGSENQPIAAADFVAIGAVWVMSDVTELARLDQMRKEFVANVSHELRTPLTTIKSYIETLLAEEEPPPSLQRQFLQVVVSEAARMGRLVGDLLDLSQLDYRHAQWDWEYTLLSEQVQQAYLKLSSQIEEKGLKYTYEGGGSEPLVYADPDRIQQVILNLLSNAIEFTASGGQINVAVHPYDGKVRVAINDTGVGIPAADLPRIFDRFYRVDKARARTLGGTGLGLSIAREIVLAHGGEIGIDSQHNRGTTVWFTLPQDDGPEILVPGGASGETG